jgi:hypothetical protein
MRAPSGSAEPARKQNDRFPIFMAGKQTSLGSCGAPFRFSRQAMPARGQFLEHAAAGRSSIAAASPLQMTNAPGRSSTLNLGKDLVQSGRRWLASQSGIIDGHQPQSLLDMLLNVECIITDLMEVGDPSAD